MADGVVEQVADQIEEVAEVTRTFTGREGGFFVAGAGIGVAIGFSVGYFVMAKRTQLKYEKIADAEIEKMREHYLKRYHEMDKIMQGPKPPIDEVMRDLGYKTESEAHGETRHEFTAEEQEAIDQANRNHPGEEEVEDVEVVEEGEPPRVVENITNIFTDAPVDHWNYATEARNRRPDVPYIIHFDEFQQNEPEHEQVTYTYYEVDDILADERDTTIDDMDATIGLGNLGKWGHGSNDPNVVYVRNEKIKTDFEILRDRGSYEATSSGSIRHSHDRRRTPQRRFDDDD